MKSLLPHCLLTLSLYISISLSLAPAVFAFSYDDYVYVDGNKYSGCSGDGNFGHTRDYYYVCDDDACGGGRLTVREPTSYCTGPGAQIFFANRSDVTPIGGPTPTPTPPGPSPTATPTPTTTPTPTPTPTCNTGFPADTFRACAYQRRDFNTYKGAFTEEVIDHAWGSGGPTVGGTTLTDNFSAVWRGEITFSDGSYLFSVTSDDGFRLYLNDALVLEDWTTHPAYTKTTPNPFHLSGDTKIKLEYFEGFGEARIKLEWRRACLYQSTSIILSATEPALPSPEDFFEEFTDQSKGFCDYALAPGSCSSESIPLKSFNGTLLSRTGKKIRAEVLHLNPSGGVTERAMDAQIIIRGPGDQILCTAKTDGGGGGDPYCYSGAGYVDFYLNPAWTTTASLASGGASDDRYTFEASTLVGNVPVTLPACTDTDALWVDACLYDSTQAYLKQRKYEGYQKWGSTIIAERGDIVDFAAFHDFTNPLTQLPPPFATDTKGHLSGPYGLEEDLLNNPDSRKFDLASSYPDGLYKFSVLTERIKNGLTYKLDESEFCTAATEFPVLARACLSPPPATDPTNCCPAQPEGTTWTPGNILATLLTPLLSPFNALPFRVRLGITQAETTTDTKKIADYLYGADKNGQLQGGAYFNAVPPYEITSRFSTEDQRIGQRREGARYSFNFNDAAEKEVNSGPLENLAPATFAAERLHKFLAARPLRPEDRTLSRKESPPLLTADEHGAVLGTSAPACTEIKYAVKTENLCFNEESEGAALGAGDFLNLLVSQGTDNLLKLKAEKLDWLGRYLSGRETADTAGADSAYQRDTAYESGGLQKLFIRPWEETPPERAGDAKADAVLGFQYQNPLDATGTWHWIPNARIDLPGAQLALRYIGGVRDTLTQSIQPKLLRPGETIPPDPIPPEPFVTPPPEPPPGFSGTCTVCSPAAPALGPALKNLLDTVGNAMKVPASVLTGMLRFEGSDWDYETRDFLSPWKHVFYYPEAVIQQISQSGATNPYCVSSTAGARGPCQFMPNQWTLYGGTIKNILGDPAYVPDICNLRDCLYAAAAKMRFDATWLTYRDGHYIRTGNLPADCGGYYLDGTQPLNECNWSLANVAAAGYHYYGACTDNYATTLVNYYLNKSCSTGGPLPPPAGGMACGISSQSWRINARPNEFVNHFRALGVTNTRFGIDWRGIENPRGNYHWSAYDSAVNTMVNNGITVVGLFNTIPEWLCANQQQCELPKDTDTVDGFEQAARAIVTHYRGKIRYWEFWNEPDQWWAMDDAADYTFWLNRFYAAAKSVDPSVVVAAAAPVGGEIGFMTTVKNGGGRFDAVTFHPYGGGRGRGALEKSKVQALRNLTGKDIWLTEYGFNTTSSSIGNCGSLSYSEQANLLRDALTWIKSQSYITIADLHMLHDIQPLEGPLCMGLTQEPEQNFAPKDAYAVFSSLCRGT